MIASFAGSGASVRSRLSRSAPEKLVMTSDLLAPASTSMLRMVAGSDFVFVSSNS